MKKYFLSVIAALISSSVIASEQKPELEQRVEQLEAQVKFLSKLMTTVQNNQNVIATNIGLLKEEKIKPGEPIPIVGFYEGAKDAPVVVMEFTDQECPYCREFAVVEYPKIQESLIAKDKVAFVHLQKPLDIHPNAFHASKHIFCAAEQGKYLEAKKEMFFNPDFVKQMRYQDALSKVELDWDKMSKCLVTPRPMELLTSDETLADKLDINSTPSFVIGKKQGNKVVSWEIVKGALTKDELNKKIEVLLKK